MTLPENPTPSEYAQHARELGSDETVLGPGARETSEEVEELVEQPKSTLYERAQKLDIEGRSGMDKEQLAEAVQKAEGGKTE